jgi:ElaB/YqjD/DUF883 family membrane-anchored ribosome-binding protein
MTEATGEPSRQEGLSERASATAQDAASVAQQKASELRDQGFARLRDQFDQRSSEAGSQMRSLAQALRRSENELAEEGNSNAAQLTGQAADRIDRLGSYLEQKSGDDLMRDIEGFARGRPWMLAGLTVLAGVAAARFIKASSDRRHADYRRSMQQWPTGQGVSGAPGELTRGPEDERRDVSDAPTALSDEPLARDPQAGAR